MFFNNIFIPSNNLTKMTNVQFVKKLSQIKKGLKIYKRLHYLDYGCIGKYG